jgi:SPP1 gp7 family putative phage head morphogenesis protein
MLQEYKGIDLTTLPLATLEGIEEAVTTFLFKQQPEGERFHPDYRKNRKAFKKLLRETVKFKREMSRFFAAQYERIIPRLYTPGIRADELSEEEDYLRYIDWDQENQTLTATLEINLGSLFAVGAKATEMQLQADLNIGPHMTEEAKFLREYTVKLSGEINDTTKKRITQQIKTSIEVGETRQQLTDRISNVLNNPKRARMIAQTESIRAYAEGRLAVGRRLKVPYKQLQSFQVDSGEICGQVNGEVVPLDQPFRNGLQMPPFHPSCRCSLKLLYENPNETDQSDVRDLSEDNSIFDSAR